MVSKTPKYLICVRSDICCTFCGILSSLGLMHLTKWLKADDSSVTRSSISLTNLESSVFPA